MTLLQLGLWPDFDRRVMLSHHRHQPRWNTTQVAYLLDRWQSMTDEELAWAFSCERERVERKRQALGLLKNKPITTGLCKAVRDGMVHHTYVEIGEDQGRKPRTIQYVATMMGLRSPHHTRKRVGA